MDKHNTEESIVDEKIDELPDDSWMVRPCEMYNLEYKDCNSLKGHFHQYFIHGKTLDCTQWKTDYSNCMKWRKRNDAEALSKVIDSERDRVSVRMGATRTNDVWKLREDKLSADIWNRPLPEWITKDHPGSYLQAMKTMDGTEMSKDNGRQFCNIL